MRKFFECVFYYHYLFYKSFDSEFQPITRAVLSTGLIQSFYYIFIIESLWMLKFNEWIDPMPKFIFTGLVTLLNYFIYYKKAAIIYEKRPRLFSSIFFTKAIVILFSIVGFIILMCNQYIIESFIK